MSRVIIFGNGESHLDEESRWLDEPMYFSALAQDIDSGRYDSSAASHGLSARREAA